MVTRVQVLRAFPLCGCYALSQDQPMHQRRAQTSDELSAWAPYIDRAVAAMPHSTLAMGYQAWLGFYNSNLK